MNLIQEFLLVLKWAIEVIYLFQQLDLKQLPWILVLYCLLLKLDEDFCKTVAQVKENIFM